MGRLRSCLRDLIGCGVWVGCDGLLGHAAGREGDEEQEPTNAVNSIHESSVFDGTRRPQNVMQFITKTSSIAVRYPSTSTYNGNSQRR